MNCMILVSQGKCGIVVKSVIIYFLLADESLNYCPGNIFLILTGTLPWPGFPVSCKKHPDAYRHARRRCAYGSLMIIVMQQW